VRAYVVSSNEFTVFENQAVDLILNELRLSASASDIDVVNAIRSKISASFIMRGAVSKSNNNLIITVRFIDAETYYIVFNKVFYSTEADIARDIRLFSEEIANEAVALTVGITLENLEKLLKLEMLDEAYRKLQYYRQKYPQTSIALKDYERRLSLALAKRSMKACRNYTELARKSKESAFHFMEEAYYEGVSALFWLPPNEEALKKDYVQFLAGTVMKYFFDYAIKEKQLIVQKAKSYLAENPQRSLEIISEFLEKVGTREIDASVYAVIQQARGRIADNLYKEARNATALEQFALAERLMNQALAISGDYARYTKEWAQFEQARTAYDARTLYEDSKASPLWDPAAVFPYQTVIKTGVMLYDKVSYDIPFGGTNPVFEADFIINSRVNDALVFRQVFLVQYSSTSWSGTIIDADTSLSCTRIDTAWLSGFSGFYKDFIISLNAGPSLGFIAAEGTMTAYNIAKPITIPFGFLPSLMLRVTGEYALSRTFSLGAEYGKSWGFLFGSGYVGTTSVSLFATVAW